MRDMWVTVHMSAIISFVTGQLTTCICIHVCFHLVKKNIISHSGVAKVAVEIQMIRTAKSFCGRHPWVSTSKTIGFPKVGVFACLWAEISQMVCNDCWVGM